MYPVLGETGDLLESEEPPQKGTVTLLFVQEKLQGSKQAGITGPFAKMLSEAEQASTACAFAELELLNGTNDRPSFGAR